MQDTYITKGCVRHVFCILVVTTRVMPRPHAKPDQLTCQSGNQFGKPACSGLAESMQNARS